MKGEKPVVLITGGTGLVGQRLSELLSGQGYIIRILTRSPRKGTYEQYQWDIGSGYIDPEAFNGTDYIVHLAGAGVADERWTTERKRIILESRTQSSQLLHDYLRDNTHSVKAFVSASAIGYYGFDTGDEVIEEGHPAGKDFLSNVTVRWEEEVDQIAHLGIRTAKIRIGVVLSEKGGALTELSKPIKWYAGAPLGSGSQFMSWIHLDDLCRMFIHTIQAEGMSGAFNGTAPNPVTNRAMTRAIAKKLNKPLWLPPVPGFVLRIIVGEMADMLLGGSKVVPKKMIDYGFQFDYPKIDEALEELL